jgi:hypothetical protein
MSRKARPRLRHDWSAPWPFLLAIAVVCLLAAITGQATKAADVEIGTLTNASTRIVLAVFGVFLAAFVVVQWPAPSVTGSETERDRVKELQRMLGLHDGDVDGLWGPKTRNRCLQQMVGSPLDVAERARPRLAGNNNHALVAWVQEQLNRKFDVNLETDGIPGRATHHAIVHLLGETDGIVGPRGYRTLTLD